MGLFDMIKKLNPESRLFGFLAGPHGVYTNNYMEITADYMGLYRNTGGFDMIRKYLSAFTNLSLLPKVLDVIRLRPLSSSQALSPTLRR